MAEQQRESEGRKENGATADYPGVSEVTPQAYPQVRKDDAMERPGNPDPPQGAGDTSAPAATNDGRMGPQGDPAEGKR